MSALARIVHEGEVLPPQDDEDVPDSDKAEEFLHRHQTQCGDYWCSRGIIPCITLIPNTGP